MTTPTAAGSRHRRHRRHGLLSSRMRSRALPGSRHPQPRDQSLHSHSSNSTQYKRGYFPYAVRSTTVTEQPQATRQCTRTQGDFCNFRKIVELPPGPSSTFVLTSWNYKRKTFITAPRNFGFPAGRSCSQLAEVAANAVETRRSKYLALLG